MQPAIKALHMFYQTHMLATHSEALERRVIDIHYAFMTECGHNTQNVDRKRPPPL